MSGRNLLYLVFPGANTDPGTPPYECTHPAGSFDAEPLMDKLQELSNYFDYETYTILYDKSNVDSFIKTLNDDLAKTALRRLLFKSVKAGNWRKKGIKVGECSFSGIPIKNETFSHIVQRKTVAPYDVCAVLDMDAINGVYATTPADVIKPEIKPVHRWFSTKRTPKRVYNWNPKHGENGVGAWPGESKLLCDRNEAERLLHFAIGVSGSRELYLYDAARGAYMRYKYENVDSQYHSFHVDQRGINARDRQKVLAKLGKL